MVGATPARPAVRGTRCRRCTVESLMLIHRVILEVDGPEADDLEAAVRAASRVPAARDGGAVEICRRKVC